ncbi:unnamed protein product [Calicophoron daubneyi]|uniref:Mitogen-activated protein kinase kinase kinase kinase n=1 Tax=Calicophoron daubneyi TaxID=300641 RepID=A0AAV2TT22_CALDB
MSHPKLEYLKRFVKQNDPKEEYKVLACIGSGTYGDVFKAIHRETREPVAVKIMKIDLKDDIQSICQEIHTLRECRHPNIVQFYGSYLRNNKLWICMEYCGGQSMQDIYLFTRRPLEEDCIAFVSRETLQGLNFMHDRGRIHRDIKGANILLTDDGRVKIADFGVAAQLNNTIGKRTTLIGTPYWMAPEVASIDSRGAGYDGKCDIWGVGITAIEYAELQPPMFDLDPRKVLQILGRRDYKPPSLQDRYKWSQRFYSFVKCCLVKNERRRPDAATMLTHTFVTNPNLSTLLTQRLLNFKRQLELKAKQPQHPSPVDHPKNIISVPQNGQPRKAPALANDQARPTPPAIPPAPNFVRQQVVPQFVPTRHILLPSDARLLAAVQMQETPYTEAAAGPKFSDGSSELVSNESLSASLDTATSVVDKTDSDTKALSCMVPTTNSATPSVPLKNSPHQYSSDNGSGSPTNTTDSQKTAHLLLRINSSHSPDPTVPSEVGGEGAFPVQPYLSENRPFPEQILHTSSEDLLREVMDAFEKRRSRIDFGEPLFADNQRFVVASTNEIRSDPARMSLYENYPPPEPKLGVLVDNRRRMAGQVDKTAESTQPLSHAPVRTHSKRRAPPPPPPPSFLATPSVAEETVTSGAEPCVCQVSDSAPELRLPARYENQTTEKGIAEVKTGAGEIRSPDIMLRCENSKMSTGNSEISSMSGDVPPRPPPPKVDTGSLYSSTGNTRNEEDEKRFARQHQLEQGFGLPPTPKVHMGACFMLLFEGCPLKVNSTATWVNPQTRSQVIFFGTNDGIYFLNLLDLADGTLELLIPRPCVWLSVLKDTMMSLCGQRPQLYSHNLITLMKSKTYSQPKFLHKRFQATSKVPDTRGCHIANVIRNPYNGMKYLCGAIDKTIIVMEWYNPRSTFIEVKRVEVPNMPSPILNFDLIISQDQTLPLVCLGVFATADPLCYKLHLVNLNDDENRDPWLVSPPNPEDQLQVIKVVQLEYNTLLICFQTHATIVNLNGRVKVNREGWKAELQFGATVNSIVCLQDSVLAFHTHGLRGIGFDGQLTQDINDDKHVYRLLGCDKNVVVESRPSDDPMSNSNIYLLAGHKELY